MIGSNRRKNPRIRRAAAFFLVLILLTGCLPVWASALSPGDLDGNGKINSSDARTVLRFSARLISLSREQQSAADVNADGKVNSSDARILLRVAAHLQTLSDRDILLVHFLDVGQADSILIEKQGAAILVDGGNTADGAAITAYLKNRNILSLDYVVGTHAHEDHIGGLSTVLNAFPVKKTVYAPKTGTDTNAYSSFVSAAYRQGKALTAPSAGSSVSWAGCQIQFFGPISEPAEDINNTSIVFKLTYGETSFLFTGDASYLEEKAILEQNFDLQADVLKVGHHGSETSTGYVFLREIMPEYAVISVGEGNSYSHPHENTLSRLRDADVQVYRTDLQGTVILQSDGKSLTVRTEKQSSAPVNPTEKPDSTAAYPKNYIGNVNSKIFHLPSCSYLPAEKNRVYFDRRETAVQNGYTPCKRCAA